MGDQTRGQSQQLPTPAGYLQANIRGGLRPINANIGSPNLMSRPQTMNQPLYIVPRANLNHIQAAPQPNLLHVRSLASGQTMTQANGMAWIAPHTRPYSPSTVNAAGVTTLQGVGESTLAKFLRQVIDLYQKKVAVGAESPVTKLIQKLIDDEVDCDSFCNQLCDITKSVNNRTNVESLVRNNVAQLRRDLATGTIVLPHITPPTRPTQSMLPSVHVPQTTVFVNPGTILNPHSSSTSATSQILPRPPDGLPANATFQLPQAPLTVTAMPRSTGPYVQSSPIFAHRPIVTATTPTIAQQLNRTLLKPTSQPTPIRMKTPISPATFQAATHITPQRGSLFSNATSVRPIYPAASMATIANVPVSVTSPPNPMNLPFFPISQIRSHLANRLTAESNALLSDEAMNCLAHGLEIFLRSILTRVSVVAGHKTVKLGDDPRLEQLDHTREQLNYIQRLEEHDKKKQSELQNENILKAAKSRTRSENPDQARIREMATQLKNERYERERQQQANRTALNAIGLPANRRPRPSFDPPSTDLQVSGFSSGVIDSPSTPRLSFINSAPSATASSRLRLVQTSSNPGDDSSPLTLPGQSMGVSGTPSSSTIPIGGAVIASSSSRFNLAASLRTRRAGLRDLQVVMAKDPRLCRSRAFYRSHWR